MKRTILLTAFILGWSMGQPAARAEPPWPLYDGCNWSFPSLCDLWAQRKCWCPDDYWPKLLPCVPPNPKGCVDDYCPKKLPCLHPNPKGCCDDYCPTKCPLYLGSLCEPWYICGPPERCTECSCKPGK